MRNKNQILKRLSPTSRLPPRLKFAPDHLLPPPPEQRKGPGSGGCGQFIAPCLCCSFLLTFLPCPSVGSLPRETVLHELVQRGSPHRLQSFRKGLLQHRGPQALPAKLLQHGLLALHRPTYPARSLLQCGVSMGRSLLWASACSSVGSSTGCRWRSALPWTSTGCRGTACLTVVFTMGWRGISAPVPGAPTPSPSWPLVSAELFFSHVLTPLFWQLLVLSSRFFPLPPIK